MKIVAKRMTLSIIGVMAIIVAVVVILNSNFSPKETVAVANGDAEVTNMPSEVKEQSGVEEKTEDEFKEKTAEEASKEIIVVAAKQTKADEKVPIAVNVNKKGKTNIEGSSIIDKIYDYYSKIYVDAVAYLESGAVMEVDKEMKLEAEDGNHGMGGSRWCTSERCKEAEGAECEATEKADNASEQASALDAEIIRLKLVEVKVLRIAEKLKVNEEKISSAKTDLDKKILELKSKEDTSKLEELSKSFEALIVNYEITQNDAVNESKKAINEANELLETYKANATAFAAEAIEARKIKEGEIAEAIRKNNSAGAVGNGANTYPKRGNCPQDNLGYSFYGGYVCQCVSYTGWKVFERYGIRISAWGNANQWHNTARRLGYRVDHTPEAGSVAISTAGPYGHAMWVEAVNPNGTINLSEYNNSYSSASHRAGDFGYRVGVSTSGMWFIHF